MEVSVELQILLKVLNAVHPEGQEMPDAAAAAAGSEDAARARAGEFLRYFFAYDLPVRLIGSLVDLEFEVRKDVLGVFSTIVRLGSEVAADAQLAEYVQGQPTFFSMLVEGYGRSEIATHCGIMLRSCARHARLVEIFLGQPEIVIRLASFASHESFDVSGDAFSTLHDLLLTHKAVSAVFLEANFQEFFKVYNGLLTFGNTYVTQRQGLKLLSETLLDRKFMRIMLMYIGNEQFLQIHMNLLKSDSKAIQFEAFHVFKIFVANPQKPPKVQQILFKNRERIVKLLDTLRASRPDDRQFVEDQSTVIAKLQAIQAPS